jgi:hypothetical protein
MESYRPFALTAGQAAAMPPLTAPAKTADTPLAVIGTSLPTRATHDPQKLATAVMPNTSHLLTTHHFRDEK